MKIEKAEIVQCQETFNKNGNSIFNNTINQELKIIIHNTEQLYK